LVFGDQMTACKVRPLRRHMGNLMGSMETFLLLRSLRTLSLRINRQSETAWTLANWLHNYTPRVVRVWHPFLPNHPTHDLGNLDGLLFIVKLFSFLMFLISAKELLKCGPACFYVDVESDFVANNLPTHTNLFSYATSLGGVESLIEPTQNGEQVRISIGLEDAEDLIKDLEQAFDTTYAAFADDVRVHVQKEKPKKSKSKFREDKECVIS
jgi:cystathionine gamma-synthase